MNSADVRGASVWTSASPTAVATAAICDASGATDETFGTAARLGCSKSFLPRANSSSERCPQHAVRIAHLAGKLDQTS